MESAVRKDPRCVGQQGVETIVARAHGPSERSFGLNLALQLQPVKRLNIRRPTSSTQYT